MAASALRIHWGMDRRNYFCEIKKDCTLKKTVPCY